MRRLVGRAAVLVLAMLLLQASPSQAVKDPLVGGGESGTIGLLPQWTRVLEKIAAERAVYTACGRVAADCAEPAVADWSRLVASLRGVSRARQIRAVNTFVNRQPYRTDMTAWGHEDYWATPLEFLARSGDCEDYGITKYVSLRRLGVPSADLRLLVVRDHQRDQDHAVLAARDGAAWYILDNLSADVLPQEHVPAYAPYYALNEAALWIYATPSGSVRTAGR